MLQLKRDGMERLEKSIAHQEAQRRDLHAQLQAVCKPPGAKENPKNKNTIIRIMKAINAKDQSIKAAQGMLGTISHQCEQMNAILLARGGVDAMKMQPSMKSDVEALRQSAEKMREEKEDFDADYEECMEVLGSAGQEQELDDDELEAKLAEMFGDESPEVAAAAEARPTVPALPAAGRKAAPVAARGGAAARADADDELERLKSAM